MEKLKRGIILLLLVFPLVHSACVSKPSFYNRGSIDKANVKIAVLPFKDFNDKEGNNSGELVNNLFESILLQRGFKVIEVEKTAVEADYEFLEKNEFASVWIMGTGTAIGADYMVYGSVHDYKTFQSSTSFLYIFSWLELTSSVGITARMVSCKTGEIVWTGSLTRASYTINDAAAEAINDLIRTIRYKSAGKK